MCRRLCNMLALETLNGILKPIIISPCPLRVTDEQIVYRYIISIYAFSHIRQKLQKYGQLSAGILSGIENYQKTYPCSGRSTNDTSVSFCSLRPKSAVLLSKFVAFAAPDYRNQNGHCPRLCESSQSPKTPVACSVFLIHGFKTCIYRFLGSLISSLSIFFFFISKIWFLCLKSTLRTPGHFCAQNRISICMFASQNRNAGYSVTWLIRCGFEPCG
jgi:hypothetical protein